MPYQFDATRPIYIQIMEEIKKRLFRGQYDAGVKLPSIRDLAKELAVNPNTITRAYMELEREGFLFTKRGQGSFITEEEKRIEDERFKLAESSIRVFVDAVKELDLQQEHLLVLLDRLRKELNVP